MAINAVILYIGDVAFIISTSEQANSGLEF